MRRAIVHCGHFPLSAGSSVSQISLGGWVGVGYDRSGLVQSNAIGQTLCKKGTATLRTEGKLTAAW